MNIIVDKLSGSKVKINIEVSAETFDQALDRAFAKAVKNVEIKGFRKGKVPRTVFEQKYGTEVLFEDAVNFCISETYGDAVEANNIEVVAMPKIDLDFDKVAKGKGFKYSAEVAVKPELELGKYTNLGLEQDSTEVTETEIKAGIESLLKDKVTVVEKDSDVLENGDVSVIDFEGFVGEEAFEGGKGEGFELTIGSGQFIPGFEAQMVGMKKGETKDVLVTFPTEYHAENLAGADAKFVVTLHDIKVKQTPELTDEVVASLEIPGVTNADELHAYAKERIASGKAQQSEDIFVEKLMNAIVEDSKVAIADEHIDAEMNKLLDNVAQQAKQYKMDLEMFVALAMGGKTMDQLKEELTAQAERKIKFAAVLDAVVKAENITVDAADLDAKYAEFSTMYNMGVEQIQAMIPAAALAQDISYEKAIKFLMANAK